MKLQGEACNFIKKETATFFKKDTPTQVFSWEVFKNTYYFRA